MSEQSVSKPWYRYPIVWLVVGIPMASVVSGMWFLYISQTNPNDVIKDNYYKDGLAINQQFAEDEQARRMNLRADVTVVDSEISVAFLGPDYPFIEFKLFHVKDRDFDVSGAMAKLVDADGKTRYVYRLNEPLSGRWYLQLNGEQNGKFWRLKGRLDLPMSATQSILPAAN